MRVQTHDIDGIEASRHFPDGRIIRPLRGKCSRCCWYSAMVRSPDGMALRHRSPTITVGAAVWILDRALSRLLSPLFKKLLEGVYAVATAGHYCVVADAGSAISPPRVPSPCHRDTASSRPGVHLDRHLIHYLYHALPNALPSVDGRVGSYGAGLVKAVKFDGGPANRMDPLRLSLR